MPKAYLKYYTKKGGIIRQSVTADDEENHKLRTIVLGADFQDTTLLQCDILYMHHGCLRHLIPYAGTNGNQSPMHTGVRYETLSTCTRTVVHVAADLYRNTVHYDDCSTNAHAVAIFLYLLQRFICLTV